MEKMVTTLEEFEAEAERFARELAPAELGATLVTLSGDLGAGKTAFAKAVARVLGVRDVVTSPTFVIEKVYQLPARECGNETPKQLGCFVPKFFSRLVHIDAYRLASGADLAPLRFEELLSDPSILILLEWPEMVADALRAPSVAVALSVRPDGTRTISYA